MLVIVIIRTFITFVFFWLICSPICWMKSLFVSSCIWLRVCDKWALRLLSTTRRLFPYCGCPPTACDSLLLMSPYWGSPQSLGCRPYCGSPQSLGCRPYCGSLQSLGCRPYCGSLQSLGCKPYCGSPQSLGFRPYCGSPQSLGFRPYCGCP